MIRGRHRQSGASIFRCLLSPRPVLYPANCVAKGMSRLCLLGEMSLDEILSKATWKLSVPKAPDYSRPAACKTLSAVSKINASNPMASKGSCVLASPVSRLAIEFVLTLEFIRSTMCAESLLRRAVPTGGEEVFTPRGDHGQPDRRHSPRIAAVSSC